MLFQKHHLLYTIKITKFHHSFTSSAVKITKILINKSQTPMCIFCSDLRVL